MNSSLRLARRLIRIARRLVAMSYQYVADRATNDEGDVIRWGYEDEWHHKINGGFNGLINFGKSTCLVKDAYFTLKGDMIEWEKGWLMQGTFYGNWESGTNNGGTFIGGLLRSCDWLAGDFTGGKALNGVVFHGGNLTGGEIIGAVIDGAVINGADCNGCKFQKGKFLSGSWENGKWLSSTQPEPPPPKVRTLNDNVDFHAEMEKAIREHKTVKFNYMKRDGTVELMTFLPTELKPRSNGDEICIGWKNGEEGNEEMRRTLHVQSMGSLNRQMDEINARKLNVSDIDNPKDIEVQLKRAIGTGEYVTWIAETSNGNVFPVTGKPIDVSEFKTPKPNGYDEERLLCTFEATNGQTVKYGVKIHDGEPWELPQKSVKCQSAIVRNEIQFWRTIPLKKERADWQRNLYMVQAVKSNTKEMLEEAKKVLSACHMTLDNESVSSWYESGDGDAIVINVMFPVDDDVQRELIRRKLERLGYSR